MMVVPMLLRIVIPRHSTRLSAVPSSRSSLANRTAVLLRVTPMRRTPGSRALISLVEPQTVAALLPGSATSTAMATSISPQFSRPLAIPRELLTCSSCLATGTAPLPLVTIRIICMARVQRTPLTLPVTDEPTWLRMTGSPLPSRSFRAEQALLCNLPCSPIP